MEMISVKDVLVIVYSKNDYFFPFLHSNKADIVSLFRTLNRVEIVMLKILRQLKLPLTFFYERWKKDLSQYNKIVVFDAAYSCHLAKYLNKHSRHSAKYLYYWNPITKNILELHKINQLHNSFYIYSFDKNNCEEYGFKYNSMVYSSCISLKENKQEIDVVFLGFAKDRLDKINNIYKDLVSNGIRSEFYVVNNVKTKKEVQVHLIKNKLSYDKYLYLMAKSKVLLDLTQENQRGFTIRILESIFLEKKLITDNKDIVNYDIYNSNNIFVLGLDNWKDIKSFINKPYQKLLQNFVNYYDFEYWIERFIPYEIVT